MNKPSLDFKLDFLPENSDEIVTVPLDSNLSFLEIASRFAYQPGTIALTSGGSLDCARYNILGINPWLVLRANLTYATIATVNTTTTIEADPLDILQFLVKSYKLPTSGNYPLPLISGLLGYLSYDLKDCIEVLPRTSVDDLHLPHLYMVAPSIIVVEDRFENKKTLYISTIAGNAADRKIAFLDVLSKPAPLYIMTHSANHSPMQSCFKREEYMQAIEDIRDYIVRGHVYQVNMSQRFEASFHGDPYELFMLMFARNPAPFFAYINAGDHHIVSTSPERFIELRENHVETRPIKGTRPRGKTPEEDLHFREDLTNSKKDDAELSMIVDLLRNDIGKVCSAGSVKVREHKRVEAYENVLHNVSIIDGILDKDRDVVDLIRATFPGGSITGCPKIRSMEIIDELEPVRRHLYTGSIGYIGFHDTMDLSIAIRTATIKDGRLVFSVGGGIVYDSNPADEYQETLHKGKTLMNAIGKTEKETKKAPIAWCNGRFRPVDEFTVSFSNEGFLYGYGIFETIRVQNGKTYRLQEHLDRFNKSWDFCFGTHRPDISWDAVIMQVLERNNLLDQAVAVKVLAAAGQPGKPVSQTLLVTARPYTHRLKAAGRDGLYLATYPHSRESELASHKTMNYMLCKMANDWAKKQGADEALILNSDDTVSETATANILCTFNGKWYSPLSKHVLPGTMEKAVSTLLENQGLKVEHRSITLEEFKKADQIYLTNALMGIVPVLRIDNSGVRCYDKDLCNKINERVFR